MDKLIVDATKIRGLGNILSTKSSSDFILKKSSITTSVAEINNLDTEIFSLTYNDLEPEISTVSLENNTVEETLYIGDTIRLAAKVSTNSSVGVSGVTVKFYIDNTLYVEKTTNAEGIAYLDYTIASETTNLQAKYNDNIVSDTLTVSAVKRDTIINIEE